MAKKTNTKVSKVWAEDKIKSFNNFVSVYGKVKKLFVDTDKVQKFSLEIPRYTDNKKIAYAWVTVVNFDTENTSLAEGEIISVEGYLNTNHYNDTWTTEIIATDITEE